MKNKSVLVWFRNDLRVADNDALLSACEKYSEVYTVYCWDERLEKPLSYGFSRISPFRKQFLSESLFDLSDAIKNLGGKLLLLKGSPANEVAILAKKLGVASVFYSKEVCTEETQDELLLQKQLAKENIDWEEFWTSTLIEKNDLPFSLQQLPDVFTKFRNKVERECAYLRPLHTPDQIHAPLAETIESYDPHSFLNSEIKNDSRAAIAFKGGASAALARLNEYVWEEEHIATYKETRNGLVGKNYSSKFSPWLANGSISAKIIVNSILDFEEERIKNDSTYWMIFELLWRDFFRFTAAKQGSKLFHLSGFNQQAFRKWRRDRKAFEAWCDGFTGDDFVDANMIELKQTGWMSNRGRQNVASYLVHDLGMDWRWGAAYFEYALIDYDPASNWGNWAYIAGVGNDPRPDRKFNTQKQANDYDRDSRFRNLWLSKKEIHK